MRTQFPKAPFARRLARACFPLGCYGLAASMLVASAFAQSTSPTLPAGYEASTQTAAESVAQPLVIGLKQMAKHETGSVELIELVKMLRASGFSEKRATPVAQSSNGSGRASSEGSPGRDQRGSGRGGSTRGGSGHGGGAGGGRGGDPSERFNSLDADGDGVLTGGEIGARMQGTPPAADNSVTLEEFKAAWAAMMADGGSGHSHGGGGGHSHGGGRGGAASQVVQPKNSDAEFLLLLDQNRDRKLTLEEVVVGVRTDIQGNLAELVKLDADHDGKITLAEFAMHAAAAADAPTQSSEPPTLGRRDRGRFARIDTNSDETLDALEIVASATATTKPRLLAIGVCCALHATEAHRDDDLTPSEITTAALATSGLDAALVEAAVSNLLESQDVKSIKWSAAYPAILKLANNLAAQPTK